MTLESFGIWQGSCQCILNLSIRKSKPENVLNGWRNIYALYICVCYKEIINYYLPLARDMPLLGFQPLLQDPSTCHHQICWKLCRDHFLPWPWILSIHRLFECRLLGWPTLPKIISMKNELFSYLQILCTLTVTSSPRSKGTEESPLAVIIVELNFWKVAWCFTAGFGWSGQYSYFFTSMSKKAFCNTEL